MLPRNLLLSVWLCVLWCTSTRAAEGFHLLAADAPAPVRDAWSSVYNVEYKDWPLGTAFLVGIAKSDTIVRLYFLTAEHIAANDDRCTDNSICSGLSLVQNAVYNRDGDGFRKSSENGSHFSNVRSLTISDGSNTTLLTVDLSAGSDLREFRPLKISQTCLSHKREQLYAIGYPDVGYRPNFNSKILRKVWSKGVLIDLDDAHLGTSIDATDGNSGGPILNAQGEVVSVMNKSWFGSDLEYEGDYIREVSGHEEYGPVEYSQGTSCAALSKKLAATIGVSQ